ncbi:uncharacterized protein [Ptychodera flava]|uniref:uncharacterized protein n=1 Tax=Ptychodera flava TaxID=63121 RepID=UPI00396A44F5
MSCPGLIRQMILLSVCVTTCISSYVDLSLEIYTIFNPMPFMVTFETGTNVSINVMSITIRNNGPDDIPSLHDGQIHYDIGMYIMALKGGEMRDPVQVQSFSLNDEVVLRRSNAIASGADQAYQVPDWPTAVINYPAEKCKTHSHLCVVLEHVGNHTDNNSDNDFFCLPFVNGLFSESVGPTNCPSDIVPLALNVISAETPMFVYDTPTTVTIDIQLHNAGGTIVPGGIENIGFSAFVASNDSADADLKIDCDDVNVNTTNIYDDVGPWSDTVYSDVIVKVTVPGQNCTNFKYLCIVFKKASENATFQDDDTNNLICLPFGEVSDGGAGVVLCPTDQELPAHYSFVEWWAILVVIFCTMVAACSIFVCLFCIIYINLFRKKNKVDVEKQPAKNIVVVDDVNKIQSSHPNTLTECKIQYT